MKKHLLKFLSVICSVFVCGIMSAQTVTIEGLTYAINLELNEASLSFADGKSCPENIVIQESVLYEEQSYPVVGINSYAFESCTYTGNITSITIPSSIKRLGDEKSGVYNAFYGLSKLVAINVDPDNAFFSSSDGVLFNKDKTSLFVFPCHKAGDYNVPNGVTAIKELAFNNCTELTNLSISNTVLSIGYSAISGCKQLKTITIPASVKTFEKGAISDFSGDLYIDINSIEEWLSNSINENLAGTRHLMKNGSELTAIKIPNSLSSIGYNAFGNCGGIESVEMPNTITSISNYAFYECPNLSTIKLSNSLTQIGSYAFYNCAKLGTLELPSTLTSIGNNAFHGCSSITELTIPESVTRLDNGAFENCTGITSLNLPNSLTSISPSLFKGCTGLTSLRIPDSVTSIGSNAFSGCSGITSLKIPNNVDNIGAYAFADCSGITLLTLPNTLYSIPQYAFKGCSGLTTLNIPVSVSSIENYAFSECTSLTTVELPEELTAIKQYAFNGCKKLDTMTLPSGITTLGNNFVTHCKHLYAPFPKIVKANISLTGTLHVPTGATSTFRDNGWSATYIYDDIDMGFLIASGTYNNLKWELEGSTLTISSTYGTPAMAIPYKTIGGAKSLDLTGYPWYEYRFSVKHVVIKGLKSLGVECLRDMDLQSLTTNTHLVGQLDNTEDDQLFYCFGTDYVKSVTENSVRYSVYKFRVPSSLKKIIYTGEQFASFFFVGGSINSYTGIKTEEYHPKYPLELIANRVTNIITTYSSKKALGNTKLYLTYTGEAKSGMLNDLGDLYSLTINSTGVATKGGAFYTLFGSAYNNKEMMYGEGGYYIPMNLKELHLMEGVSTIPESCFKNVTSLEKVYLPSTLRGVQENAFLNCDGLTDIYVNAAMPPSAKENSFDGVNLFLCTLHVPYDSKEYYSIAKGWKDFYSIDNDADIRLTILKNIENAGQIIGTTSYMNGETTNITAVANGGYKFIEWTDEDGNRISDKPVLSIVATTSCVYHAIFAPISNTGTVECTVNGISTTLTWKSNDQDEYYKIQLYTSPDMEDVVKEIVVDANEQKITSATCDELSVEISDLDSFTRYYYRVAVYDSEGNVLDVYIGSFETTENTSIIDISSEDDTILEIYNISGEKIELLDRGFNIIRMKNGTTKKIFIK